MKQSLMSQVIVEDQFNEADEDEGSEEEKELPVGILHEEVKKPKSIVL